MTSDVTASNDLPVPAPAPSPSAVECAWPFADSSRAGCSG